MNRQPSGLIQVLLDEMAEYGDRHDAAMDLGSFDAERVENALVRVASDKTTDEDLADACGESLAEVWCRKGNVTKAVLFRLPPTILKITLATLRACSPSLAADAENMLSAKPPVSG